MAYNSAYEFTLHPRRPFVSPLLPLFPLDLVLLPGATLPLHIFEPRYREMIGECIEQKRTFGVVRAKEQGISDVGCTAEIVTVANTYPDGRMDIVTRGIDRFEVMQVNQDRSFLQAEVLYLRDSPDAPAPGDITKAVKLHGEILSLAGAKPESSLAVEDGRLAFHIASSVPLDLDFKQNLLAMNSEAERIAALIGFFEAILPKLRHSVHVRQKAGGNGHAL